MNGRNSEHSLSRRRMLQMSLTGAAAGVLSGGLGLALPLSARAQDVSTPDAALAELMAGNKRFANNDLPSLQHDLDILKQHTVEKQEPFAAVLSCADSRVPVEIVFDQSIGHIFVTRVAGNVITPETHRQPGVRRGGAGDEGDPGDGSLQLRSGEGSHQGKAVPGQISSLFPHIQPAIDQAGHDLVAATKANAKIQATLLSESSPVISGMVKDGKIKVVAGDLAVWFRSTGQRSGIPDPIAKVQ
jgi:carbonic anhydrase